MGLMSDSDVRPITIYHQRPAGDILTEEIVLMLFNKYLSPPQAGADSYADDCQPRLFLCELAGSYIQIKKAFTELKMGSFGKTALSGQISGFIPQ